MNQERFRAQMNRLAAAYRVDVSSQTRAAYWLAFQTTSDERFDLACERAIEHEKAFPSIAGLKEIIRVHHEVHRDTRSPLLAGEGSVGCRTCGDAGFVRRDGLAVSHPDFGKAIPCPHCDGAKKPRDLHSEAKWYALGHTAIPRAEAADGPLRPIVDRVAQDLRPDEEGAYSTWTAPMPVDAR
jgi:hypothetical protein